MMLTKQRQHDHQQEIYDKEYAFYKDYLVNWRKSYLKRLFKYFKLKRGDKFLDVGVGGSGYTVIEVARKGIDAYGIDISREAIKKAKEFAKKALSAKQMRKCHFEKGEAERLPYPDRYFNKICCIAVLEHVVDDEKAIKELSRVIKENGRVFLTVPHQFQSRLSFFRIFNNDRQVGHLRRYDEKELLKLTNKYGLILEKLFYHGHYIKILQHLLELIFPHFEKRESKFWWFLDRLDLADWKNPNSYHITLVLKKAKIT